MIHKVEVQNKVDFQTTVVHHFEQIVDNDDEAKEFGHSVYGLIYAFGEGFSGAYNDDPNNDNDDDD